MLFKFQQLRGDLTSEAESSLLHYYRLRTVTIAVRAESSFLRLVVTHVFSRAFSKAFHVNPWKNSSENRYQSTTQQATAAVTILVRIMRVVSIDSGKNSQKFRENAGA